MQTARVGHPERPVGCEAERQRVDGLPTLDGRAGTALLHHAPHVRLGDGASAHRPLHAEHPAFRRAAGEVHQHRAEPVVGLDFGITHRAAHRLLRPVQVGDPARPHAAGLPHPEAEHA